MPESAEDIHISQKRVGYILHKQLHMTVNSRSETYSCGHLQTISKACFVRRLFCASIHKCIRDLDLPLQTKNKKHSKKYTEAGRSGSKNQSRFYQQKKFCINLLRW